MSNKTLRWLLVAVFALAASFGSVARADIDNASATNVQEGDNETTSNQRGSAASGDAVGGSVVGVVSSGDASVDATNRSEDVEITTGDATGTNGHASFTGLTAGTAAFLAADILNAQAINVQEGDNEAEIDQDASAATGDGVGGQVIGIVTTAGGEVDVVAANTSRDVDIETGDAEAFNDAAAFVGLNAGEAGPGDETASATAADIENVSAINVQEGDNELSAAQDARAATGDGVGGQVIGAVSAGRDPIDATNRSEDVEITTGDAFAANDLAAFVGLTAGTSTSLGDGVTVTDIFNGTAANVQEGDNEKDASQSANAASGDAVGGQVVGVVTSTGGVAELVLANTSLDVEATSGDSDFVNEDASFTGLNAHGLISVF